MLHEKGKKSHNERDTILTPVFGSNEETREIPKFKLSKHSMSPKTAYQIVHDECMLDGNARLNLATFVTTWMEPEARQLMLETMDKNMIDKTEYPQTAEIERRCVNIIANLWNTHEEHNATGCSTLGSSEACMLGGLALKWRWRSRMKKANKAIDKPNLVISSGYQVVWEKFCRYWDITLKEVPMEKGCYRLDVQKAVEMCDENTIGVVAIMGITYTGQYDDVKKLNDALDELNKRKGFKIPIHVDAASGGFITPFLQPEIEWDFRLKWVHSINTSGHKYGLVYPGVGWIIWKKKKYLPDELVFDVDYLGGKMPTMAINFSRPGNQVLAQYYELLRLGKDGYTEVQSACRDVAMHLSKRISNMEPFELITDGSDIPVFCWTLKEGYTDKWDLFDLADRLMMNGWQVPAYKMPINVENMVVQRIVVKQGMSYDMAGLLLDDMEKHVAYLNQLDQPISKKDKEKKQGRFAHL